MICPLLCAGLQSEGPVQEVQAAEEGLDRQLILAVVGSASATCLTILAALLTLVCIRKSCLHRRRTFTYQSGSVSHLHPPQGTCVQTLCRYVFAYVIVHPPSVCVYVATLSNMQGHKIQVCFFVF